jgi:hypothetical protein
MRRLFAAFKVYWVLCGESRRTNYQEIFIDPWEASKRSVKHRVLDAHFQKRFCKVERAAEGGKLFDLSKSEAMRSAPMTDNKQL